MLLIWQETLGMCRAKALSQTNIRCPVLIGESEGYWKHLSAAASSGKARGPKIHDARIAALATFHGVEELWSADRDFQRFPGVPLRNPLV